MGEAGIKDKPKPETWYAKVTGFSSGIPKQPKSAVVDITGSGNAELTVSWFYDTMAILEVLADKFKDECVYLVKHALREDEYILGMCSTTVSVSCVECEGWGALVSCLI